MAAEPSVATPPSTPPARPALDLFLISLLILFLELACIRWFPAHVLFLTFFTNVVLLACFVGMSVGCLAAGHQRNYLSWTPILLLVALLAGLGIEALRLYLDTHLNVGTQSKQIVYFGTEHEGSDPAAFRIPIEVICGFFFAVLALAMVGPGQELGRALNRVPNRVQAYTVNIFGSIVGIVLFATFSWFQLSPLWWFVPVVLGLGYFLVVRSTEPLFARLLVGILLLLLLLPAGVHTGTWNLHDPDGNPVTIDYLWSPYYRIDYEHPPNRMIWVNLIGHQAMRDKDYVSPEYALPHLLHRDVQRELQQEPKPFEDVLIIGAGSGNDISRALDWGVKHIDAVEIDPVIQKLGERDHPMHPYQNHEQVTVHLDDGRNFLRTPGKKYDLIIYALVDSLVLHSSYSNIRLESYLFTKQAFEDIRQHLKPGGLFVTYNYFRQGWIVARLKQTLEEVFGEDNAVVLTYPFRPEVNPERAFGGFTVVFAGEGTGDMKKAFQPEPGKPRPYVLPEQAPTLQTPNGFSPVAEGDKGDKWEFAPAKVLPPQTPLRSSTDDWPFLYVREPMIPDLSLRGMAVMGAIALALILVFLPRREGQGIRGWSFDGRMFFLGAGFMLIETKAVIHMALLFGSTWMVNSVVFFAVLVMILLANLFVLKFKPENLWPYYVGLLATLALNCLVPLDYFLGMDRTVQVIGSCLLVFAPILFAGVIFAVSFRRTVEPNRAFGANIAGAMLGGLAENTSMLLGFQYLVLVALAFYTLSALFGNRGGKA
jgi:SAM-dependent methyltransferase